MTENHPITPPPELVREWNEAAMGTHFPPYGYSEYIATAAARWGSDQELEACCEWLRVNKGTCFSSFVERDVRAARRPKPPSPKEEALKVLEALIEWQRIDDPEYQALRHALEQLDD